MCAGVDRFMETSVSALREMQERQIEPPHTGDRRGLNYTMNLIDRELEKCAVILASRSNTDSLAPLLLQEKNDKERKLF